MAQNLPDIFNYIDFRHYLSEYQKARHSFDKEFSRVKLCRKLGLPNSRSYFTDVVNGKKVSSAFTERFVALLGITGDEARYFRLLVKYDQAESADEKELFFDRMLAFNSVPAAMLKREALIYYKEWYHSAVRAILDVYDLSDDYAAIAKALNPPITARQAKESVKLLLSLKLITKNNRGCYKPVSAIINTGLYAEDDLIRHYQMQLLNVARDELVKKSDAARSIATKLLSVSPKGYERIDRRLKLFLSEISAIVQNDTDPADRVYHLDIQFFPGSCPRKGEVK